MKILVINGPNLNLLERRDSKLYGNLSLVEIKKQMQIKFPTEIFKFYQSNHEGEIIDLIQISESEFDGIIINPGGFAHSSVAIRDSLDLVKIPKIEVHLSNLSKREEYRHKMITATACNGYISGLQEKGYFAAVFLIKEIHNEAL